MVDETKTTGSTLMIAHRMIEHAFPEAASVQGLHWMYRPRPERPTTDVPVWYRDDEERGRGVGNRDFDRARASHNRRQPAGWMFLSNRYGGDDTLSPQLRREIRQLHDDVGHCRQPIVTLRDDELTEEHLHVLAHWFPDVYDEEARRRGAPGWT